MSKKPNLGQINSPVFTVSQLNTAYSKIDTAFENTLSLDGSSPNAINTNLDMNSNNLLNVDGIQAQTITVESAIIGGKEFAGTITWKASWLTGTAYDYLDVVNKDGVLYICLEAHTSGVFMTDLTNTKWEVFISNTTGPTGDAGAAGQGVPVGGTTGQVLAKVDGTDYNTEWVDASGGGSSDHGALTGLGDDDHTQYHNNTRGDARYYTQTQLDAGQLDTRYFTEAEVTSSLSGKANTSHTHTLANVTDVTITVANLNTLDDGANTTLHFHNTDRDRANHTGTQLAATISDFSTAVAATAAVTANTAKVTNATHTGDVTGSTTLTLATVNSDVGTFGSATQVPTFTVNAKGLITAAGTNTTIALPASQITDFAEAVDDRVSTLLVAGTDITLTYNDAGNTLTIASTASGGGGSSQSPILTWMI